MKHRIRRRIIYIFIVLGLWCATELTLRAAFASAPYMQPPVEHNAELAAELKGVRWDDLGPLDYQGRFINVRGGERVTAGQPSQFRHQVYMFGSSTVFGATNDDAGTLSSALQVLLPDYRVRNLGAAGNQAITMLAHLRKTNIRPGDIVLFFNGTIEGYDIYQDIKAAHRFDPCDFMDANARDVLTIRAICQLFDNAAIADMTTGQSAMFAHIVDQYLRSVAAARQYTEARGATFYSFIQPYFMSTAPTQIEQALIHWDLTYPGYSAIFDRLYPMLRTVAPRSLDFSHVLDASRESGVTVYSDPQHLNDTGNAIVARALYDAIWQQF